VVDLLPSHARPWAQFSTPKKKKKRKNLGNGFITVELRKYGKRKEAGKAFQRRPWAEDKLSLLH
jgi:hypothetical protein